MHVAIADAKARLSDLVRRAEAGEEIVLTRHGKPSIRFMPVDRPANADEKWALLEALRGSAKANFGPCAARSQDFLYDDYGLPV